MWTARLTVPRSNSLRKPFRWFSSVPQTSTASILDLVKKYISFVKRSKLWWRNRVRKAGHGSPCQIHFKGPRLSWILSKSSVCFPWPNRQACYTNLMILIPANEALLMRTRVDHGGSENYPLPVVHLERLHRFIVYVESQHRSLGSK